MIEPRFFFNISLSFLYGFDNCEAYYAIPNAEETTHDKERLPNTVEKIRQQASIDPDFQKQMNELEITDELLSNCCKPYNIFDIQFDMIDIYKLSLLTNLSVDYILGIIPFETSYDFIDYMIKNMKKVSMHPARDKLTYMEYYQHKSDRNDDALKYRIMNEIHNHGYTKFSFLEYFNEKSDFPMSESALYNLLYRKNGIIPVKYIVKIAELFNTSLDYLLCYSDQNIPNQCYIYHPRFEDLRKAIKISKVNFKSIIHADSGYKNFSHEIPIGALSIRLNTLNEIVKNFSCSIDWIFGFKDINLLSAGEENYERILLPENLKQGSIVAIINPNNGERELSICIGKDKNSGRFVLRTGSDKKIEVDLLFVNNFELEVLS